MTNTALTDPEVIERRYPVRIERMSIRRGSGGDGGEVTSPVPGVMGTPTVPGGRRTTTSRPTNQLQGARQPLEESGPDQPASEPDGSSSPRDGGGTQNPRDGGSTQGHPGGDGIDRRLRFLAPAAVSLVTQRRTSGPAGLLGGAPGAPGRQWLEPAGGGEGGEGGGEKRPLPSVVSLTVAPGDLLVIQTPGGGGCGSGDDQ